MQWYDFFTPLEFSGTLRRDCKELNALRGRVSPSYGWLWAGLVVLIGFGKFRSLQASPNSICFPGLSVKVIPEK